MKHRNADIYSKIALRMTPEMFDKWESNPPSVQRDRNWWNALMITLKLDRRHRKVLTARTEVN